MSALIAKVASGAGWRRVAALAGAPGMTVRGWLRCFGARAERVRVFFTRAGLATGVDLPAAGPSGSVLGDALAALGLLVAAVRQRFGQVVSMPSGMNVETVSGWQIACAASGGRLLAPGWPGVMDGVVEGDTPETAGNTNRP